MPLKLCLLGPPEVYHDRAALTFRLRKSLALLVYLAIEGGLHSREKLTLLLWPDSSAAQGRATLRNALSFLRRSLDPTPTPDTEPYLIVERDMLGFNPTHAESDVQRLHEAVQAVQALQHQHTHPDSTESEISTRQSLIPLLQQVVRSYRGDFLAYFDLEDAPDFSVWASVQRETCHQYISLVFEHLAHMQADSGDITQAIATSSRWVALDALNEVAHRQLIQLHLMSGDRGAALRAYDACVATLEHELHMEPSPETIALAERIRQQPLPAPAHTPAQTPTRQHQYPAAPEPPRDVPMVGRTDHFVHLTERYHRARQGQAQAVVVAGEAGIGKTRMAVEFLRWASAQGADVVQGHAFETGGRLSYQPMVDALRRRIEQADAPETILSQTWLAELGQLLPELRDRYPHLPTPTLEAQTARMRLFEAVMRLGHALAHQAPLVLFIDDIQWADTASLDLLHYLGKRWSELHVAALILLTLRTESPATMVTINEWLGNLARSMPVTHITLTPLSFDDTLHLIHELGLVHAPTLSPPAPPMPPSPVADNGSSSSASSEWFGQWLFDETGGQPFYVLETFKALLENDILMIQPGTASEEHAPVVASKTDKKSLQGFLPAGIRDVIRSRLSRLSPAAMNVLTAAAVLGHRFTFTLLCKVADIDENDALVALDDLVQSRLLAESRIWQGQQVDGYYDFTHDKIREVVYATASAARKQVLHRRALDTLQAEGTPAGTLVEHALVVGLDETAFRLSLAAGDEDFQLFAMPNAIEHYKQARALLHRQPAVPGSREWRANVSVDERQHLFLQLGQAYQFDDEWEQAHVVYQEALEFARQHTLPLMECAILTRLATVMGKGLFDPPTALTLLNDAYTIAAAHNATARLAEIEWNMARMHFFSLHANEQAIVHGERARDLARQIEDRDLIGRSLNILALTRWRMGQQLHQAETEAIESHTLFNDLGNRPRQADSLRILASIRISLGRPQEAIIDGQASLDICLDIENDWRQANGSHILGKALCEQGLYTRALDIVQAGLTKARTCQYPPLLIFNLVVLGEIYRMLFCLDDAYQAHLEAESIVQKLDAPWITEIVVNQVCADCVLMEDWQTATTYAHKALATRNYVSVHTVPILRYTTEALLRSGEVEAACDDVQSYGAEIGTYRRYRPGYLQAEALLAGWHNEWGRAGDCLQQAVQIAADIGLPGEQWMISAELAQAYHHAGQYELMADAYTNAAAIIRQLAEKIENTHVQTSFLNAPAVQHVLNAGATG
jgi:DNA-binding SARP family transcriptional activator/tetratricopeptide (TPR) repeat protein